MLRPRMARKGAMGAFHPIRSFDGKADQPVTVTLRRACEGAEPMEITVTPRMLDGETMFVDAMRESIAVIERSTRPTPRAPIRRSSARSRSRPRRRTSGSEGARPFTPSTE